MKSLIIRFGLAFSLCLILSSRAISGGGGNVWAIPIQAQLKTVSGAPVNGTVTVVFTLWNALTGGSAYWSETRTVDVVNGLLVTSLGQVTALPDPLPDPMYLAVKVGSDPVMTPRIFLNAVPYAGRLPNVYPKAGKVGIGTSIPSFALDVHSNDRADLRLLSLADTAPTIMLSRNAAAGYAPGSLGRLDFMLNDSAWGSIGSSFATSEDDGLFFKANYTEIARLKYPGMLELRSSVGDKLVLYRATDGISTVGMGVQGNLLQVHSDTNVSDIAFGYGSSDNLTETVRISHLGRVGIGTKTPAWPLDIVSPGQAVIKMNSASAAYGSVLELNNTTPAQSQTMIGAINFVHPTSGIGQIGYLPSHVMTFSTFNNQRMNISSSGLVGINVTSPNYRLDVGGSINATGNVMSNGVALTSDARYKQGVETLTDALGKTMALRGVSFDWNRAGWPKREFPEGRQVGFIAQEVEKVLPEVVTSAADGSKMVAYQNIVPVLVEAIKAQQKQIDELKAQVERLTAAQ